MSSQSNATPEGENSLEVDKHLALADLQSWIDNFSEEELDQPYLMIGRKTFSPRQIMREIEASSEDGRAIVHMLTQHRLEKAKRNLL